MVGLISPKTKRRIPSGALLDHSAIVRIAMNAIDGVLVSMSIRGVKMCHLPDMAVKTSVNVTVSAR